MPCRGVPRTPPLPRRASASALGCPRSSWKYGEREGCELVSPLVLPSPQPRRLGPGRGQLPGARGPDRERGSCPPHGSVQIYVCAQARPTLAGRGPGRTQKPRLGFPESWQRPAGHRLGTRGALEPVEISRNLRCISPFRAAPKAHRALRLCRGLRREKRFPVPSGFPPAQARCGAQAPARARPPRMRSGRAVRSGPRRARHSVGASARGPRSRDPHAVPAVPRVRFGLKARPSHTTQRLPCRSRGRPAETPAQ